MYVDPSPTTEPALPKLETEEDRAAWLQLAAAALANPSTMITDPDRAADEMLAAFHRRCVAPGPVSAPMVFSIRPEYVARIIDGSKRWEFRTRMPKVAKGDTALIYESRGRGRIVAAFTVGSLVHSMPPDSLWETIETMDPGSHGISRKDFFAYFEGRSGVAIGITDVKPLDLELPACMRAPQSWARWRGPWPLEVLGG